MNLSALSSRDFRYYLLGNIFALNGMWIQRVTIGWIAWDLTRAASFVGLIAFLNFGPTVITGPLFGVLTDRVNLRRAALTAQSALLCTSLILLVSYLLGFLNAGTLAAFALLIGIVSSAYHPIRMSLAPMLVERGAVSSVVTFTSINFNLARLTGPAIGGWIIALWGIGTALLFQVLFYLPFILALYVIRPRERSISKQPTEPFLDALRAGMRHALRNDLIRHALVVTGAFAIIIRGTLEILPVIADGVFDKGAVGLGLLTSSAGIGALLAGATKALLRGQSIGELPRPALLSATIGIGLVPVLGVTNSWPLALFLVAGLAFTASLAAISMQTSIQLSLDDGMRGRVMSIWVMVGIGASAAGAVLLGSAADVIGLSATLAIVGATGVIGLVAFVFRIW